ncbi:MalY/PatB family protein [Sphingosinicella rhizophila]|uniref:cysteine-S-conjugate beta-lyase n=1 Tax=Sphingosinicella rhizophila TaxID=3050082 RepID=A0ABU3QA90_9SPHN|nr:aminotransferase class I/II-fold pyridoxal phosphate-dependent enzyme [Sphingosinicella sp. GR2756]MDT9600322.1 aminotransferase class I/II-fold pyridoxal phosphate-dependent enzyme [Sphingosinicella sp. GR2756]
MIRTPPIGEMRQRIGRKWSDYPDDVIPAWVADMDFDVAPGISATIGEAIMLGDFGYGPVAARTGVPEAFAAWAARRWNWRFDPEDVKLMPEIISGVDNVLDAFTRSGDAILLHTPLYPSLTKAVRLAGRRPIEVEMADGEIDVAKMAEAAAREGVRMILLCHPHNPWGRRFRPDHLEAIAALAERRDLVILSDEVHADLSYEGHPHIPMAMIAPERTVTLNAPSKAFNMAGLRLAVCVIPPALRAPLAALSPNRWTAFSALGIRAALAAWSVEGEEWLNACMAQLAANRSRLVELLAEHCPEIRYHEPDAGYLAWLDCRALGFEDPAEFFLKEARVALSSGPSFGASGAGFARLNFATSPEILATIIEKIGKAVTASS